MTFLKHGGCSRWRLYSPGLDPAETNAGSVYCEHEGIACRPGFSEVQERKQRDPRCAREVAKDGGYKRCMVPGMVRVLATGDTHMVLSDGQLDEIKLEKNLLGGKVSEYFTAGDGTPFRWRLQIGKQSILLAIPPGDNWTIHVSQPGEIRGNIERRVGNTR